MNRYDQFLDNDYSFQQYSPQEWQPNLEVMDEVLTGLQTEYDTGLGELERIMPNYLRQSESDTQAAQQFRQKYDNLIAQTTDAFTKGNINEGRRMMREGLREIEKDQLSGGEYHELERRVSEFDTEDKKLQTIYLDPKSKQYNPEMYNYYKQQLLNGITPFKDEQGKYGSIQGPDTRRIYTDLEESDMMIGAISKLPASQYAVGPKFEAQFSGMTIGDVMSQGLVKHLDANKIEGVLRGIVGQDLQMSSQEKQRARQQEVTQFLQETGELNPNDPLGQKALQFMESFAFSQEQMLHRFIPSNLGGEGSSGRSRTGAKIQTTQTPNAQIVQTPTTTEIKTDNQLAEDGTYLPEDKGLDIYKNTERLFKQKTQSLPETLATTLENEQVAPEAVLNGVFYKYMPDTADEFGTIQDADYYQLPSEVFTGDKYTELQQSFQLADPSITPEQAKMKADQLIKQADYLYMGINEDVAYYKKVRENYKDKYVEQMFDDQQKEIYNWSPEKDVKELEYYQKTIIDPLTDTNVIFEGVNNAPVTGIIRQAARDKVITPEQEQQLYNNIDEYRKIAEARVSEPTASEIKKELESEYYDEFRKDGTDPLIIAGIARGRVLQQKRNLVGQDVEKMIADNNLLQGLITRRVKQQQIEMQGIVNKYDNAGIHSQVSQELLPDLKRSMPVLNYLSQGFDWNSESTDYDNQEPIRQLQIDGRGLYAKVNNDGELVQASNLVESANIFKVSPGQMFEKDGFMFELNKDQSKVMPKEKENIAGIIPIGFVKGPDNKIYYYGQTQVVDEKESGNKVKAGDYVYYEYSSEDNLTQKFYNALGAQDNVYEDLHFFNKQLDMEKISNTDQNASVNTYIDENYFPGRKLEIRRNDTKEGYRYKAFIDGVAMDNNRTMSDSRLAEMLSTLKMVQSGQRGDRNNNPTAFTTDIAKQAGLVEGVDYQDTGDVFTSGDNTYTTAKIIGDPVQVTQKVINNIGFYTQDGNPRWSYITKDPSDTSKLYMTDAIWKAMSTTEKAAFIKAMEVREGGSLLNQ